MNFVYEIKENDQKSDDFNIYKIINKKIAMEVQKKDILHIDFNDNIEKLQEYYVCYNKKTGKEVKKGNLPFYSYNKNLNFEKINGVEYEVKLKDTKEVIYNLKILIIPIIDFSIYVREYNKIFDSEDVSWYSVKFEDYIPSDERFSWYKYQPEKADSKKTGNEIDELNYHKHSGIYLFKDNVNQDIHKKIRLIVIPVQLSLINHEETILSETVKTVVNIFEKDEYMLKKIEGGEFEWIKYNNYYNLDDFIKKINRFENEIIKPFPVQYEVSEMLQLFLIKTNIVNTMKLRNSVYEIKKKWKKIKQQLDKFLTKENKNYNLVEINDKVMKFDEKYQNNPYKIIKSNFEDLSNKIDKRLLDFLFNTYFSLDTKKNISVEQSFEYVMDSGVYLSRFRNYSLIKEYLNRQEYDHENEEIVFIPDKKDTLELKSKMYDNLIELYVPIFEICYLRYSKNVIELKVNNEYTIKFQNEQNFNKYGFNLKLKPEELYAAIFEDKKDVKIKKYDNDIQIVFKKNLDVYEIKYSVNSIDYKYSFNEHINIYTFHKIKSKDYDQNDRLFGYSLNPVQHFWFGEKREIKMKN